MLSLLGSGAINMSTAMNKHATVEDVMFSMWSMPTLYNEDQLDKPVSSCLSRCH
jgi:hypothetical protein